MDKLSEIESWIETNYSKSKITKSSEWYWRNDFSINEVLGFEIKAILKKIKDIKNSEESK